MPHRADFSSVMMDALALIDKVATFYAKYHILEFEERRALIQHLKHTHTEWAKCTAVKQQHVDFITVLLHELRLHYQEWMQHDRPARKRWLRHPGESLKRLTLQTTNTTAMMEAVIVHQIRKLAPDAC